MSRSRVLVVDDDEATRQVIHHLLARWHDVTTSGDVEGALRLLALDPPDVLVTDVRMPGGGGPEILRQLGPRLRDIGVIVVSGEGTLDEFTDLARLGVADYLIKPVVASQLVHAVARALELRRLRLDNLRLRAALGVAAAGRLVGDGRAMQAVRDQVARVAPADATVLVTGETGTGKELVARAIHDSSERRSGPFVVVSCGALADTLLESELFGHVRGAFTGAEADRAGCFEAAHGGTLFLDEVTSMSDALQVRLLRVLAEREITRVGDRRVRSVDVRIVAAANKPLDELVDAGRFRADLYFRLKVVQIRLPRLSERGAADVEQIAQHCVAAACDRFGRPAKGISGAARERLVAHAWPGNVRELENCLARAVILSGDSAEIEAGHLLFRSMPQVASRHEVLPDEGFDLERHLRDLEHDLIRQALERTGGNRRRAAELLGLRRTGLVQKLARLGLPGEGAAEAEAGEAGEAGS